MEKISGIRREDAIGRLLMGELFSGDLKLKGQDLTKFMIVLNKAIDGNDTDKFPFTFLNKQVGSRSLTLLLMLSILFVQMIIHMF